VIRWLVRIVLALVLVTLAGIAWRGGTTAGASLLVRDMLPRVLPGFAVEQLEGTLWQGLGLRGVAYADDATRVTLDGIEWSWDLSALWDRRLHIASLRLGRLIVELGGRGEPSEGDGATVILPFQLQLPEVTIAAVEIRDGQTSTVLEDISASLEVDRQLRVQALALTLAEPLVRLQAQGEVTLDDTLMPLALDFDWQGELRELGASAGRGRLNGNLADLSFEHQLAAPYVISSRGRVSGLQDDSGVRLEVDGDWQGLRWPVAGERLALSEAGRYRVVGPLDALAFELRADLTLQTYPRGDLELKATLRKDRVELASLVLSTPVGRMHANGRVGFSPAVSWQLALQGEGLDPALLGEPWSGRLDLRADASGRLEGDAPSGRVSLRRLHGVLRDYPFDAHGEILLAPGRIAIEDMQLSSGDADFTADGQLMPGLDLDVVAKAPDLAQLWPGLSGELNGQARISGMPAQPELRGEFAGSRLAYADLRVEQLDIALDWPSRGPDKGLVRLVAEGLVIAEEQWDRAELRLEGAPGQHRLTAALQDGVPALDLILEGGWDGQTWQGELQQLRSEGLGKGVWVNEAPAPLRLAAENARLAPLCLVQASQQVCLGGKWRANGPVDGLVTLQAVELDNLAALLPPDYLLEGQLTGEARVSGPADHPTVKASLVPSDGRLVVRTEEDDEPLALRYSDARVDLDYQNGALKADAGLLLQERARARLSIQTRPDPKGGADRLQGSIEASLPDLQALAALVPQGQILAGSADASAQIGGTVEQPRVTGELNIFDTVLEYPDLGLRLEALRVRLASSGDTRLTITGGARSGEKEGEGDLRLDGWVLLEPDAGWPLSLNIRGERVVAVRLPDTRVLVSPDLQLGGNAQALEVKGRVVVPEADIEVRELPAGAITVSGDEILLDAGIQQTGRGQPTAVKVSGRVALELGDKVRFKGFGLTTLLQGKLGLQLQPGYTEAVGNIDLQEGRYKAWGQDLNIEQGRLLFAGPVDNPGVDLRALRVSKDGEVKAYLEVSGNLRKPVTKVRTEPATSDTDALSYLLNGTAMGESEGLNKAQLLQAAAGLGLEKTLPALNAIQEESGLDELGLDTEGGLEGSALVAGKYLTPDLYLRYIQGLFDPSAILSLRYRLSEHASVETRSGTTQSVELIYTLEHD